MKVKEGKCGECACPRDYSPVCGQIGDSFATFGNLCELECEQEITLNLTKVSDERCRDEDYQE